MKKRIILDRAMRWLETSPQDLSIGPNNKGTVLSNQGKLDDTKRCFDRALAIDNIMRVYWRIKK